MITPTRNILEPDHHSWSWVLWRLIQQRIYDMELSWGQTG
jgi:hypothetical protein